MHEAIHTVSFSNSKFVYTWQPVKFRRKKVNIGPLLLTKFYSCTSDKKIFFSALEQNSGIFRRLALVLCIAPSSCGNCL